MTLGEKLSKEKFRVISVLGVTVFILSWLFGLKSFKGCINVWNPKDFGVRYREGFGYEKINGFVWTQECATAAVSRRFDIIFFGMVIFVGLVFGYLLLCWHTVKNSVNNAE